MLLHPNWGKFKSFVTSFINKVMAEIMDIKRWRSHGVFSSKSFKLAEKIRT